MNIDHTNAEIQQMIVHKSGNPAKEDNALLSDGLSQIGTKELHHQLRSYFFQVAKDPKRYELDTRFTDQKFHQCIDRLFQDRSTEAFVETTQEMTEFLTQQSNHPRIKSGFLLVARLTDVRKEENFMEAIAVVKAESQQSFFRFDKSENGIDVALQYGFHPTKIDKACLILKNEEGEYEILAEDKSSGVEDAKFWFNDFLRVKRREDDYYNTENVIEATKYFVHNHLRPNYDIDKTDEAHIMNKSKNYLQTQNAYDKDMYAQEVFEVEDLADEWNQFQEKQGYTISDGFEINPTAVNKQKTVFRSVLKLDKNFHVYIHGDRSRIERGVDEHGRKFYRLFYDQES